MNRRSFVKACMVAVPAIGAARATAHPIAFEQVRMEDAPVASPAAMPDGAPVSIEDNPDILRSAPWELEGEVLTLRAPIYARYVADDGHGYEVGVDHQQVYRSFLLVEAGSGKIAIATNDDLSDIEGMHTARFTGTYAGLQEYLDEAVAGIFTVPLIIASRVEPAS